MSVRRAWGRRLRSDRLDTVFVCDFLLVILWGFLTDIDDLIAADRNVPAPERDDVYFFSAVRTFFPGHAISPLCFNWNAMQLLW